MDMALLRPEDLRFTTPEDICTHLGEDSERYYGAVSPPIYQTSLFARTREPNPFVYTRVSNPTTEIAERKIAALEGADGALLFGSGMAAISSAILSAIEKDAHVVCVTTAYPDTRKFLLEYLHDRFGVTTTLVRGDTVGEFAGAIRPNTRIIYLESPSTSVFKMQDLEPIARLARERGITTIIDNTYATPLFQNPIRWGIDIVCHTVSKYLGGHANLIGGVLCARREIIERMRDMERALLGGILGPHEAWLLINGLRTFPARMRCHNQSALVVAHFLENHDKVERVFYPGLDSYSQKSLYMKYMSGSPGLLSFVPRGTPEGIIAMIGRLNTFQEGVSWGGYESLVSGKSVGMSAEQADEMDICPNLVRIHVGLENVDTLIGDLESALAGL